MIGDSKTGRSPAKKQLTRGEKWAVCGALEPERWRMRCLTQKNQLCLTYKVCMFYHLSTDV